MILLPKTTGDRMALLEALEALQGGAGDDSPWGRRATKIAEGGAVEIPPEECLALACAARALGTPPGRALAARLDAPEGAARPVPAHVPTCDPEWTDARWRATTLALWRAGLASQDPALTPGANQIRGMFPEVRTKRIWHAKLQRSLEAVSGCALSWAHGEPIHITYRDSPAADDARRLIVCAHEVAHSFTIGARHKRPWRRAYRALVRVVWGLDVPELGDRAYTDGRGNGLDGRMRTAVLPEVARISRWVAETNQQARAAVTASCR